MEGSQTYAVGYLGPAGTFSEQAARDYAAKVSGLHPSAAAVGGTGGGIGSGAQGPSAAATAELVPFRDIPELLAAVDRGRVAVGVVPAENAIEGTVVVTLDMFVHEVDLTIVGEIVIPVRHHLLVRPPGEGTAADEQGKPGSGLLEAARRSVKIVVSHPQALAQCRRYLQQHFPGAELRPALSTAAAAREVAQAAPGTMAAVGTELSAELYGLAVAAQDIQDASDNATRFFVVKKSAAPPSAGAGPSGAGADLSGAAPDERFAVATSPTGRDKTTIVFGFAVDAPGNLYHALGEFANRGINLSKLESRPTKRALGHYLFFADLDGHALDARVAEALDALARRCAYMKVLGSYPKADYAGVTLPRAFPPTGPRDSRRS